jgi:NUMOD3 motif
VNFYVYALFRENGVPFYIGKGQGDRWLAHECQARTTKRRDPRCSIIRRMQSVGLNIPKVKLHEGLTEAAACAYEIALIAAIGRGEAGPLVNLTDGGEGKSGWTTSPETRAKIGAANRGRIRTPEVIEKTAAKLRGRKRTPEQIDKAVASRRGRKLTPEQIERLVALHRGRVPTPETRAKMSAVKLGKPKSPKTRAKMSVAASNRSPEYRAKMSISCLAREARRRRNARGQGADTGLPPIKQQHRHIKL